MKLSIHPWAEWDIDHAIAQLMLERGDRVAEQFADEVDRAMSLVLESPKIGKPHPTGAREFVLSRFRYTLVYRVLGSTLLVIAVTHHRRRPDHWFDRLTWYPTVDDDG